MKNFLIVTGIVLLFFSACKNPFFPEKPGKDKGIYAIKIEMMDNKSEDLLTASPDTGENGDVITLTYTLGTDNGKINNMLKINFNHTPGIIIDTDGTGKETYTIDAADASYEGIIFISATFTHTDKTPQTILFEESNLTKTYGDDMFINIASGGDGTGSITYESNDPEVATVDTNSGEVTIVGAGRTTIAAIKAADNEYEYAMAHYSLEVLKKEIHFAVSGHVIDSKIYDNTDAAIVKTIAFDGLVHGEDLTPEIIVKTIAFTGLVRGENLAPESDYTIKNAKYDNALVGNDKTVTAKVKLVLDGVTAKNYWLEHEDLSIVNRTIKAATPFAPDAPTLNTQDTNSVTLNAPAKGDPLHMLLTMEYARSEAGKTEIDSATWQDSLTFEDLLADSVYYFFARYKADPTKNNVSEASDGLEVVIEAERPIIYSIEVEIIDGKPGDSFTVTPGAGEAGDFITLNYTVGTDGGKTKNMLEIDFEHTPRSTIVANGPGTKTYMVDDNDASNDGVIYITATFIHTNKKVQEIDFEEIHLTKTYGDGAFINAASGGDGTGDITYESSDPTVATVDTNSGKVTITGAGHATIIATKAEDAIYEHDTMHYSLEVLKKEIDFASVGHTIGGKTYDSTDTASVTAVAFNGLVFGEKLASSSDYTIMAAKYNNVYAGVGRTITATVELMPDGPVSKNYSLVHKNLVVADRIITPALLPAPNAPGHSGIDKTVIILTEPVGKNPLFTLEYSFNTVNKAPTTDWQDSLIFDDLSSGTDYYFFARYKADPMKNEVSNASASLKLTTMQTAGNITCHWDNEHKLNIAVNNDNEVVTITTMDNTYSEHRWFINEAEITAFKGLPKFRFESEGRQKGRYTVGLSVKKGGAYYHTEFIIEVGHGGK